MNRSGTAARAAAAAAAAELAAMSANEGGVDPSTSSAAATATPSLPPPIPTLIELCHGRLLDPASLSEFEATLEYELPGPFFPDLARSALLASRPILLRLIVKHWPEREFVLRNVLKESDGEAQKYPLTLLRIFLDGLGHVDRKIRVLDLRGYELHDHDFFKNYKELLCDKTLAKLDGE